MIDYINTFNKHVKDNPKRYSKKIKIQVAMIEELLKRDYIEYCESDVIAFEKMVGLHYHWKGTRKKIKLDFQQMWEIACVLGIKWKDKDGDWVRYFTEYRVSCGKKRGKSVVMSLLGEWGLCFDRFNDGAEVYCLATKKAQAKIVYDNIAVYRKQCKEIAKITAEKYADGSKYIICEETNGVLKYLSSSNKGMQGLNPSMVLFDEAQEVTDISILESLRTGMATRKQPLLVMMTTAGVTQNSAYAQMYSQIEQMCEKKKHDDKMRVFFAVYEIDIDDRVDDIKCWIKANPAMLEGRPRLELLQKEYELALIGDGQRSLPTFIAFHLNRQCDGSITYYTTDLIKQAMTTITAKNYLGQMAYGGVDLAEKADFCCATVLIPFQHIKDPDVFDFYVLQKYFKAENRIDRDSDTDKVLYRQFIHTKSQDTICSELLYPCKGDFVNFQDVANWFYTLKKDYGLWFRKIGYDPANAAQWLIMMKDLNFAEEKVTWNGDKFVGRDDGILTKVSQGTKLSDMIKLSKVLFEEKRIKIDKENKMLAYCLSNVKVVPDAESRFKVDKQKSNGRIDGAVSLLIALRAFDCDMIKLRQILPYCERNRYT